MHVCHKIGASLQLLERRPDESHGRMTPWSWKRFSPVPIVQAPPQKELAMINTRKQGAMRIIEDDDEGITLALDTSIPDEYSVIQIGHAGGLIEVEKDAFVGMLDEQASLPAAEKSLYVAILSHTFQKIDPNLSYEQAVAIAAVCLVNGSALLTWKSELPDEQDRRLGIATKKKRWWSS
jgi:hypothetical protein